MTYHNKTVWIIGASSGIGNALAKEIAGRGGSLILSARRTEKLDALNKELGGTHEVATLDVTDAKACQKTAKNLSQKLSKQGRKLDSIVFMAATYTPPQLIKDHEDPAKTANVIEVNLIGAFNVVYSVLPLLEAQEGGQLALCASVAGYRGLPKGQPYSATKAGLLNLAESLRVESRKDNIDVRMISPGFVKTQLTEMNDFKMPMMISPEKAANYIADGLAGHRAEIHFPRRFTYFMKLLQAMPRWLYFALARR